MGIGVTAPASKLEVDGSIHSTDNISFGNSSGTGTVDFRLDGFQDVVYLIAESGATGSNGTEIRFRTASTTSGAVDRMTINKNGNVGIGDDAPAAKLDVNGKTATNELQVGSGSTFSNMQGGEFTVGSSTVDPKVVTLTFPTAFSSAPEVVATAKEGAAFDNVFTITTQSISATSVTFVVKRVDSSVGSWGQDLKLSWFAFE